MIIVFHHVEGMPFSHTPEHYTAVAAYQATDPNLVYALARPPHNAPRGEKPYPWINPRPLGIRHHWFEPARETRPSDLLFVTDTLYLIEPDGFRTLSYRGLLKWKEWFDWAEHIRNRVCEDWQPVPAKYTPVQPAPTPEPTELVSEYFLEIFIQERPPLLQGPYSREEVDAQLAVHLKFLEEPASTYMLLREDGNTEHTFETFFRGEYLGYRLHRQEKGT